MRQHKRDPGPCPVSRARLSNAWTPYFASSPASGCLGGPRPLWALCLPPRSPTKTGSLTSRPGSPSSWTPGVSGQRAKAPPPVRAPGSVAAATPGSQPWPPSTPSSSRLRGNKERRRRSRSSGVVGPLRLHHGGRLAITPRLPTRPPPPLAPVRALGPPRRSGPLPGPCRRPGSPPLGLSLRAASALWAPSTPRPEPLWHAAPAFAAPTTASPTLLPPPAAPTWLPASAMVRSTSAPKPQIRWYSPLRMPILTTEAISAIFVKGKAQLLPAVLNRVRRFAVPGSILLALSHRPYPPSFFKARSPILSSTCRSFVLLPEDSFRTLSWILV